jgi:L-ascorbate metabolism protein UlaG (beta-lactamase superfamily)
MAQFISPVIPSGMRALKRRSENFLIFKTAVLFVGAVQVPVLAANLTMCCSEAVRIAAALPEAKIVPVHFDGWKHLKESKEDLIRTFKELDRENQLVWLPAGEAVSL